MIGLAVDQSTSAAKALLVDADSRVLASATRPHAQHYPQVGFVEYDAEEIWTNVRGVVRDLVPQFEEDRRAFVSIANQRETVVVFDRLSGQPLRPAIV